MTDFIEKYDAPREIIPLADEYEANWAEFNELSGQVITVTVYHNYVITVTVITVTVYQIIESSALRFFTRLIPSSFR